MKTGVLMNWAGAGSTAGAAARRARCAATLVGVAMTLLSASPAAEAAKPPPRPPTAQGSFTDILTAFDSVRWTFADGWANGSPFDNGWLADHGTFGNGRLDLRLDDQTSSGQPYTSAEYRSNGYYGYGCYEASFKPVARSGVVSSFFTFAGPYDNGGNAKHNEIDFEFLGFDTRSVQVNFWTNDDAYVNTHERLIPLWFDAAAAYHTYAFRWTSTSIAWFVDGQRIYEFFGDAINPIPKATESLHKIMMNVWPVDATASAWAGAFQYPGQPLHGSYDWVRYTAGEDCAFTDPPVQPPPATGAATTVAVKQIVMSLDSRQTQAIAKVSIVDDLGQPVSNATVTGAWSGIITSGDGSRVSDSLGLATFYSSRTRTSGDVQFCVTGITSGSLKYVSSSTSCAVLRK